MMSTDKYVGLKLPVPVYRIDSVWYQYTVLDYYSRCRHFFTSVHIDLLSWRPLTQSNSCFNYSFMDNELASESPVLVYCAWYSRLPVQYRYRPVATPCSPCKEAEVIPWHVFVWPDGATPRTPLTVGSCACVGCQRGSLHRGSFGPHDTEQFLRGRCDCATGGEV